MKVKYDNKVDIFSIVFSEEKIKESDEGKPGIILDMKFLNFTQKIKFVPRMETK